MAASITLIAANEEKDCSWSEANWEKQKQIRRQGNKTEKLELIS